MANPYEVLGVARDASADEIRKVYRRLAKESHPDLHPGDAAAEQRFKAVSAAYDIVGDPEKRKRYDAGEIDETGAERPERRYYREYAQTSPGFKYEHGGGGGAEHEDLGDIFSELFGQNARGARRGAAGSQGLRMQGGNLRYQLTVDFLEAVNGATKRVTMPDGKTLDITLPAGTADGQTIRLKGQGMPGIGGGRPGDALIALTVRPHPHFEREGDDIRTVLPVTLKEAMAGGTVRTETISGPLDVKVPKGSNTGRVLRLRGKGVASHGGAHRGDHLIELRVMLPEAADAELERAISEWEDRHPYDPRKSGDRP